MEFLVMVGVAGISLLIFLGIAYSLFADRAYERDKDIVFNFGYSIQNEIITANEVHEGYIRNITIPNKLGNLEYSIYTSGKFMFVNYSKGEVLFLLPPFTGNLHKGTVTIKNVNGNVEII